MLLACDRFGDLFVNTRGDKSNRRIFTALSMTSLECTELVLSWIAGVSCRIEKFGKTAKKLMPAAMTSMGVIAGRHRNVAHGKVLTRALKATQENPGNELQGPFSTTSPAEASCRRVPLSECVGRAVIFGLALFG